MKKLIKYFLICSIVFVLGCDNENDVESPNYTIGVPEYSELIGNWTLDSAIYNFNDKSITVRADGFCDYNLADVEQENFTFYKDLRVYYDNDEMVNKFENAVCGEIQRGVVEEISTTSGEYEGLWDDHYTWGYKFTTVNSSETSLVLSFDSFWTAYYSKE